MTIEVVMMCIVAILSFIAGVIAYDLFKAENDFSEGYEKGYDDGYDDGLRVGRG